MEFGQNIYEFKLRPTAGSTIQIAEERVRNTGDKGMLKVTILGSGLMESNLKS